MRSRRRPSAARTARARARGRARGRGNRNRPIAHASGSPAASVSTVDAAACQTVNQTRPAVPGGQREPARRTSGRARGSRRAGTRRRAPGTPPERRSWRAARPAQRRTTCVHSSIQRSRLRRSRPQAARADSAARRRTAERLRQRRAVAHGQHEHALRHRCLELLREHEVDERLRALRSSRRRARRRARSGGSSCPRPRPSAPSSGRLREDHLGRRARGVGDDDRPLALAAAGAGEAGRVRLLPAVDDEHAVRAQPAPVVLPAVLAELRDRGQHEREPRGRGGGVLDDEQLPVPRASARSASVCGGRSRGRRTTSGRR